MSRKASLPGSERIDQLSERLIHNFDVCWLLEYLACGVEGLVCYVCLRRPSVASRSSYVENVSYNVHEALGNEEDPSKIQSLTEL